MEISPLPASAHSDYYRLRTEWLRYKSQLYDGLTGLPALPAVMEDVRRIVESKGAADVVYVDLGRSGGQETKLGWAAYDGAVREFAAVLASLQASGELTSQDVVCLHTVRSDRFLVFTAGTDSSSAARRDRLLAALVARIAIAPSTSVVRSERAIQQAVAEAMLRSLLDRQGVQTERREELARLIACSDVRAVFHPIVRLADGEIIGHEA